ncbi:MAG: CPBP family intramembrane glutamic endopeptidase [Promethearchaeota archaeon]
MEFYIINLLYFLIVIPIALVFYIIILKLNRDKEKNIVKIILALSLLLFIVRFILTFFSETIGIMPYLKDDVIFYLILTFFGLFLTWFYVVKVEKLTFQDIGWESKNVKKSIIYGLLCFIPLILMIPLIVILGNIRISLTISIGKIIVALCFSILGAFYEESMFRGIIQNHISQLVKDNFIKTIFLTALIFTLTHLFYLPFDGFGIYYIFVFIMALLLSILRIKSDQISCAILHGGIVFILIIFV